MGPQWPLKQGMTAPASPRGAHALPQKPGKPCRGRTGVLETARLLCIKLPPRGAPWHALVLNLGSPAIFCRTLPWDNQAKGTSANRLQ